MSGVGEFAARMDGTFTGILRWEQLDALWARVLEQPRGWYLLQAGEAPPAEPLAAVRLPDAIAALDALLRRDHDHDYCGIVYADNPAQPQLIKIYDPNNLGVSCGTSGRTVVPRWLLTRLAPQPLEDSAPAPAGRRRWWQSLLASLTTPAGAQNGKDA